MASKSYSIVVGLDIGTALTKVVICKLGDGSVEILGLSETKTEGISCGNITNLFKLEETISKAINAAEDSAGINIKSVNVAIFGNYVKVGKYQCTTKVTNYNGLITKNDVNKLYRDISNVTTQPNCRILNIIPVHYSTDSIKNVSDPEGMISSHLTGEYNIIYAQNAVLKQFTECLNNCDLDVENIVAISEALSKVILSKEDKEMESCIIDMGAGSTVCSVFKNNALQNIISVPFGGNSITNDIKVAFGISFEQAEKLKIKFGNVLLDEISKEETLNVTSASGNTVSSIYKYDICQIIKARVQEILELIKKKGLKQKVYLIPNRCNVSLVGGCANIKNICRIVDEVFSCHCSVARLNEKCDSLELDHKFFQSLGTIFFTNIEVDNSKKDVSQNFSKSKINESGVSKILSSIKRFFVD